MSDAKNKTRKMINRILAMLVAVPAMPLKPRTAAMSAIIKNITVQPNISVLVSENRSLGVAKNFSSTHAAARHPDSATLARAVRAREIFARVAGKFSPERLQ
jgi:hypothetical protein